MARRRKDEIETEYDIPLEAIWIHEEPYRRPSQCWVVGDWKRDGEIVIYKVVFNLEGIGRAYTLKPSVLTFDLDYYSIDDRQRKATMKQLRDENGIMIIDDLEKKIN